MSATFGGVDSGGTNVHILDNGTSIFSANITGGSLVPFSTSLALAVGDRIDFVVGFGADGFFLNDTTSINASITQTAATAPEPTTLALVALGIAGLGFTRRQRR